ncbi:hypothetical protein BO71DRAFT_172307 [Aspergillus ellipticus CBS 707.79]|uniref:Uncharacterized protein n=1 Tax=Aspergillus ellipticus CBS 707.79 TaxID=1448320 RepID=A0A319E7T7_9EURO|nr:hypothetical protein BO71DRAFT_172307 [Aspergillus ellipticus CBS 707.79]
MIGGPPPIYALNSFRLPAVPSRAPDGNYSYGQRCSLGSPSSSNFSSLVPWAALVRLTVFSPRGSIRLVRSSSLLSRAPFNLAAWKLAVLLLSISYGCGPPLHLYLGLLRFPFLSRPRSLTLFKALAPLDCITQLPGGVSGLNGWQRRKR